MSENIKSYFGKRPVYSDPYGHELVSSWVKEGKSFSFGRIGMSEMMLLDVFLQNTENPDFNQWRLHPNIPVSTQSRYMGGLYPTEYNILKDFCNYYLSTLSEVDMFGTWTKSTPTGANLAEDKLCIDYVNKDAIITEMSPYAAYHFDNPWTLGLEGKTLLIAHPFQQSIENQKDKLNLVWSNKKLFPDNVKIKTLKVPLYDYLIEPEFPDWFSSLEDMKKRMESIDFDVLLVGAGFWGVPLSAHAKKIGKAGIHAAGATQLFPGIRGRRWDENGEMDEYMNEHWVRPLPEETPDPKFEDHKQFFHEGGCYW